MSKIFLIARRDFLATVSTKGFIIAIMVPPLIYTAIIMVFPRLMNNRVPAVSGGLVVIDQAGQVTPGVRRYLEPQAMAARREAAFNRAMESLPMGGAASSGAGGAVAKRAVMGELTTIEITESPAGALEQRSSSSRETTVFGGSVCWSFTRMLLRRMPRADWARTICSSGGTSTSAFKTRFAMARPMPSSTPACAPRAWIGSGSTR